MRKILPNKMFCDPGSSRLTMFRTWVLDNDVTEIEMNELYPRWKDGVYSIISEESRLSVSSQAHLNKVVRQLNERPRKALRIETPAERFNASVASTG